MKNRVDWMLSQIPHGGDVLYVGARQKPWIAEEARKRAGAFMSIDIFRGPGPWKVADVQYDAIDDFFPYDCVVMGEVLEHLENPALAVRNARSVLRPSGRLILTTPDARCWTTWRPEGWRHICYFTELSLTNLLKVCAMRLGDPVRKLPYERTGKRCVWLRNLVARKQVLCAVAERCP